MGAQGFKITVRASSAKEAYETAVQDAIYSYGSEPYSGTIKETDGFAELKKPSNISLEDFIDQEMEQADKWSPAMVICSKEGTTTIEEEEITGSKLNDIPLPGGKKWATYYVAYAKGRRDVINGTVVFTPSKEVGYHATKAGAVKIARKYVEDYNVEVDIKLEKRLQNMDNHVGTVSPRTKKVKKKVPLNTYVLFGWASH